MRRQFNFNSIQIKGLEKHSSPFPRAYCHLTAPLCFGSQLKTDITSSSGTPENIYINGCPAPSIL